MKLKEKKCSFFSRYDDIIFLKKYVIIFSTNRISILNKALDQIAEFKGLHYVYKVYVSPDESKLLIVSTANKFYVLKIDGLEIKEITLEAPYSSNLEGKGCWSFDGKSIYIVASRSDINVVSQIRRYDISDYSYETFASDMFFISHIVPVKSEEKYLLLGIDRSSENKGKKLENIMVWFDGKTYQSTALNIAGPAFILNVHVNEQFKRVEITTFGKGVLYYDYYGKQIPNSNEQQFDFYSFVNSDSFNCFDDIRRETLAKELTVRYANEDIEDALLSDDTSKVFLVGQNGLFVVSSDNGNIISKKVMNNGAQKVFELSHNVIAVKEWDKVRLFEITELTESEQARP